MQAGRGRTPNVMGIADDIVVCGTNASEHDHAFIEMLQATSLSNQRLTSLAIL